MIGSRLEFVKLDVKPDPWPFSPESDHTAQAIAAAVECQTIFSSSAISAFLTK
jgi:hypothetical protein